MKLKNIVFLVFTLSAFVVNGQDTTVECGTDYAHQYMMKSDPAYRSQLNELESQIKDIIQNEESHRLQTSVYTIPIVVHVIHLGEAVGTGTNISDAQIAAAVQGMNNRYANSPGNSLNMQMQFCLATRDPNGNATNGISRVDGSGVANYSSLGIAIGGCGTGASEESVKSLSRWPVGTYYNIWVVNKICNGQYSGWAYYPNGGVNDGTVIRSSSMTSSSTILSHELGHGFFLYHTFEGDGGNSSCPVNTACIDNGDRVCDTPPHKQGDCSTTNPCSATGVWFNTRYNYMSYCGSLERFTQGQKDRARAVAVVSPRLSLFSSLGCNPVAANDAGIDEVVYPIKTTYTSNCNFPNSIPPIVKLKNYGTGVLTSVTINYKFDNNPLNMYSWSGSIAAGASLNVTLPAISISQGNQTFLAFTTNPNSTSDGYALNDSGNVAMNYLIAQPFSQSITSSLNASCYGASDGAASVVVVNKTEITEDWEGSTDWILVNGSQMNQWKIGSATAYAGAKSIYVSDTTNNNVYTISTSSVVHFYKDFYFPVGATNISIKFNWKGQGQSNVDYMRVYLVPASTIPAAVYQLSSGQVGSTYQLQSSYAAVTITGLDANAGLIRRLVFSWRNDAATGTQTPTSIDNMMVSYNSTGNNPFTYSWNTTPVQTSATATNLPAGSYVVNVTDANSCSCNASVVITQPNPISAIITPGGPTTFCQGNSVLLTASAANSYLWSNSAMTQTIIVTTSGNYFVTVTDASGCSSMSAPVIVSIDSCSVMLNLKIFIEAYFLGNGEMTALLFTNSISVDPTHCDSITVALYDGSSPEILVAFKKVLLLANGNAMVLFSSVPRNHSYYIVCRHRNTIEAWSKNPVLFNSSTINFDFTSP